MTCPARSAYRRLARGLLLALAGCGAEPAAPPVAPGYPGEQFTWVKGAAGAWRHHSGASAELRMPEIVSGGVALLDYDGDRDVDVFLVQGGVWWDLTPDAVYPGHALLRNDGGFRFTDVAAAAGVRGDPTSYGMGAVAGDYDNDGDPDLYVTCLEDNFLYRNNGDGTFMDVTAAAGAGGGPAWSASACFLDADRDGFLDLYVTNYVEYSHALNREKQCGLEVNGVLDYCAPRRFVGKQDLFFHNNGDGTFRECAREVGMQSPEPLSAHSKGLGVVAGDLDDDGDPDLFVSNDSTPNLLFLNQGDGTFVENGLLAGCAYGPNGQARAGMGTDAADFDADGDLDLWVVHIDFETNALYRNLGRGFYRDDQAAAGLEAASIGMVGFGTDLFDHDCDGDLDLIISNGHVLIHIEETRGTARYLQEDQLFENQGGRFRLLPAAQAGAYFEHRNAGRGLATGDLDHDGDLDVVIVARDDAPVFLRNNASQQGGGGALLLRLRTRQGNQGAAGARVRAVAGATPQIHEVQAGSSYCSCHDPRVHVGLGAAPDAEVVIRWPDGSAEDVGRLAAGAEYSIEQGKGVTERRAFPAQRQ